MWRDRGVERLENGPIVQHYVAGRGTGSDLVEPFFTIRARQNGPGWKDGIETGTPRLSLHHAAANLTHRLFLFSHIPSHLRLVLFLRCIPAVVR